MDLQSLLKRAPQLPSYKAQYQAIQLETIAGSGERITVLIVAKSATEFKVIQTISKKVIECMFGESAVNINGFISLLHDDISNHISLNRPLESWQSPISGVYKSKIHTSRSSTGIKGVLFQAITSYSSLNTGEIITTAMNELNGITNEGANEAVKRISHSVKNILIERQSKLANNLGKRTLTASGVHISMDYLGIKYNAGFANFGTRNTGQAVGLSKQKLYDLETLREDRAPCDDTQEFELLAYLPKDATSQAREMFYELELSANKKDLRVRSLETHQSFADTIISHEHKAA